MFACARMCFLLCQTYKPICLASQIIARACILRTWIVRQRQRRGGDWEDGDGRIAEKKFFYFVLLNGNEAREACEIVRWRQIVI